ncbi:MAG: hypothetical protein EBS19_07795 [Spirochaetia bacterium]|nr:hypothetical protein [Spirochaetia bacterium]
MNTYKFRAECLPDVIQFMVHCPELIQSINVDRDERFPDCYITLQSHSEMPKILNKILEMQGDVHVIFESLQPEGEYTGERIRSFHHSSKDHFAEK